MKNATAILLLGVFGFNLFGYQLIATFLENQANKKIELAIDSKTYQEGQLYSIKVATNLPYYTNSPEFQRIEGEIEVEGVYYKYVKCRIYNDSLELLCIPNEGKMKIQAAKADFSRLASDFQSSHSKKNSPTESKQFKKALSEFEEQQTACSFTIQPVSMAYFTHNSPFLTVLLI